MNNFCANEPTGPLESRWEKHLFSLSLISPQNRKKHKVIVVGTGLAGASLCATLGEAGYQVSSFCFQDSPRRAHSIAAQGGIMQPKTIKMMVIVFGVYFTILLKVAILERANLTSIV